MLRVKANFDFLGREVAIWPRRGTRATRAAARDRDGHETGTQAICRPSRAYARLGWTLAAPPDCGHAPLRRRLHGMIAAKDKRSTKMARRKPRLRIRSGR